MLSLLVLLSLYAGLEASFLWWFPRVAPAALTVDNRFRGLNILFQSSKSSVLPHDYIALFGDSNALGMGDWFTSEMHKPMARYQTAHVLQDVLGKDVVSFAAPGAGSMRGLVTEPVSQFEYLQNHITKKIGKPALILAYFYEGNDLYDNASYFQYSFPRLFDPTLAYDTVTYRRYIETFALRHDSLYRKAHDDRLLRHFPFTQFLRTMFFLVSGSKDATEIEPDTSFDPPWILGANAYDVTGSVNFAIVGGKQLQLPDRLQGPALGLDEEGWRRAWYAFDRALEYSLEYFSASRFVIVYVPSVLGTYHLAGDQVSVQPFEKSGTVFARQAIEIKSAQMRQELRARAQTHGVQVIDTTEVMRDAASRELLHGPGDWNHLNRRGYEVLAHAILQGLQLPVSGSGAPHKD